MDRHLKITSLPPLTCERISQLLTHDPNALISQFVLETALQVSEKYAYDGSVEDMCVMCNSDMLQEGSGLRDSASNVLSSEQCLVTCTTSSRVTDTTTKDQHLQRCQMGCKEKFKDCFPALTEKIRDVPDGDEDSRAEKKQRGEECPPLESAACCSGRVYLRLLSSPHLDPSLHAAGAHARLRRLRAGLAVLLVVPPPH